MSRMYFILAISGWAWLVVVALVLIALLVWRQRQRDGIEVVERHEKQS